MISIFLLFCGFSVVRILHDKLTCIPIGAGEPQEVAQDMSAYDYRGNHDDSLKTSLDRNGPKYGFRDGLLRFPA